MADSLTVKKYNISNNGVILTKKLQVRPELTTIQDIDRYTRGFNNAEELIQDLINRGDLSEGNYYRDSVNIESSESFYPLAPLYSEKREKPLFNDMMHFRLRIIDEAGKDKGKKLNRHDRRAILQSDEFPGLDDPRFFENSGVARVFKSVFSPREYDRLVTAFNRFSQTCLDNNGQMKDDFFFEQEEYTAFEEDSLNFYDFMFEALFRTCKMYTRFRELYFECLKIPAVKAEYDQYPLTEEEGITLIDTTLHQDEDPLTDSYGIEEDGEIHPVKLT